MAVLIETAAVPTYEQLRRMSPNAAGEIILHDRQHGIIEAFEGPAPGMRPPNMAELQLFERPILDGPACVRRRWTVSFLARDGDDISLATINNVHDGVEIAAPSNGTCPAGRYTMLAAYSVREGWAALRMLDAILGGRLQAHIRCKDETSSGLCQGDRAVRRALGTSSPWLVGSDGGETYVWFDSESLNTEVRFASADPSRISVTRRIPPPF